MDRRSLKTSNASMVEDARVARGPINKRGFRQGFKHGKEVLGAGQRIRNQLAFDQRFQREPKT